VTSNSELVTYLKDLSSLFNDLIEKSLRLEISIINQEDYFLVMEPFLPNVRGLDRYTVFGALDFSGLGVVGENGKIILFNHEDVKECVKDGNLGICELSFAHELGHLLNWDQTPSCVKKTKFTRFICQYSEGKADQMALEILEKSPFFEGHLLFNNSLKTPREILQYQKKRYCPDQYIQGALKCPAIAHHGLTACPKIEEIKAIELIILGLNLSETAR